MAVIHGDRNLRASVAKHTTDRLTDIDGAQIALPLASGLMSREVALMSRAKRSANAAQSCRRAIIGSIREACRAGR